MRQKVEVYFFVLIIFSLLSLSCKRKETDALYLLKIKNKKIYTGGAVKRLYFPFSGNLKGIVEIIPQEKSCLLINNEKLCMSSPHAVLAEGKISLRRIKGNASLILKENFTPLARGFFKKGASLKIPEQIRLYEILYRRRGEKLFRVKFSIAKRHLPLNETGEYLILDVGNEKEWIDRYAFLKDYSYLKIGATTYQVKAAFPPFRFTSEIPPGKSWRLSFSIILLNLPPEYGRTPEIGDGVIFKISAIYKNGRKRTFFMEKVKSGVFHRDISIPAGCTRLIFETLPGKNKFGDLAFWSNPYLYRPGKGETIILISMDTVRAKSLSLYGNKRKTTPFLDEWAPSNARIYRNAYTPHPWTLAAHKALFFSTYAWEKPEKSFVEKLQERGYYTFAFTGGGLVGSEYGFARGFVGYFEYANDLFDSNASALLYYRATDFLKRNISKKTFLFLHTYQAHAPYNPPEWANVFGQKGSIDINYLKGGPSGTFTPLDENIRKKALLLYEEEIYTIDQRLLKELVRFLKENRLYENSHIIILSDHGEQFFEHGAWEHGYSLYQEEIHIPLIVKSRKIPKGNDEDPISLLNVAELISRIAGFQPHLSWHKREDTLFFSTTKPYSIFFFPEIAAVIRDGFKYIKNLNLHPEKFKSPPRKPRKELYNLKEDPEEKNNLALKNPKKMRQLDRLIDKKMVMRERRKKKLNERELRKLKSLGYVE